MTAKEYLAQHRTLNDSINAKLEQVAELRRKAQTVGGGSDGTRSSAQPYDRIGEITAKICDLILTRYVKLWCKRRAASSHSQVQRV